MSFRTWSLAGTLRIWFSLATLVPLTIELVVGGILLLASANHEVVSLLREELEEARIRLQGVADPFQAFPGVHAELASHHPTFRFAWSLGDDRGAGRVATFGGADLLGEYPIRPTRSKEPLERATCVWQGQIDVVGGLRLHLVVDGQVNLGVVERYWVVASFMAVLSLILALVVARVLSDRVARLFQDVAARVRPDVDRASMSVKALPTEIREVADGLHASLAEIRDHHRETQLYTAGLAHELRSPLQNLLAQTEIALMRTRDADFLRRVLVGQLDELQELGDAVDNLLALCGRPDPSFRVEHETFDLLSEWQLRAERERRRAATKEVDIAVCAEGNLTMTGDREALLRGIRNVVGNAIHWSPQGGTVKIVIRDIGERIVVQVDDDGPGIAEADRVALFRPFARVRTRPEQRAGFGLGLVITKAAMEQQGGTTEIETSPSGGARLRLTMARRQSHGMPRRIAP